MQALNIGGYDYTVRVAVGVAENGDCYYYHKLSEIEQVELLSYVHRITNLIPGKDNSPNKSKLLSIAQRITNPRIDNSPLLSEIDDKRLLQILQDNPTENSEIDIRYSRKQSVLEQAKSGKSIAKETLWEQIKNLDLETYKVLYKRSSLKLHENLADSRKPVIDFIHSWKDIGG
ncbi:hypothetical protein HT665_01465 [Ursidibacter maritimus]|uniref:Uncharacterized protein n=1 Tax=Ursidibacter maritimus TaxID=1331689 RepID=A0A949T0W1_9PAST|nr:hypothetical protein [Ursidibacter maritimus]KAE9539227.1 hypothetical protein A1D26_04175 [Ursidibacter maritimus]MBV6524581.1 hypothetical protein [Ursidibacter maritimus]MBV6525444.1 hypothetical protein [Ursidibacter maritimus]MBV6526914.1 hypothetical protein [Ursidibacter maritimus]MBV6530369.1 hypothetical protein [Ursidibacter maritimus]